MGLTVTTILLRTRLRRTRGEVMAKKYYSKNSSLSGQGNHANMPTEVIMKDWGLTQADMPENYDDSMEGVDKQIALDNKLKKAHMVPKKV